MNSIRVLRASACRASARRLSVLLREKTDG
jgi:hypothetical protein